MAETAEVTSPGPANTAAVATFHATRSGRRWQSIDQLFAQGGFAKQGCSSDSTKAALVGALLGLIAVLLVAQLIQIGDDASLLLYLAVFALIGGLIGASVGARKRTCTYVKPAPK